MATVVIETVVPFDAPAQLLARSAVGKVPLLVTDNGPLGDSRVICEYLDTFGEAAPLLPEPPWADRMRSSEGDAIMDSALLVVLETRREKPQQSSTWIEHHTTRIERIISRLTSPASNGLTLGDISIGCALHYLDFRLPHLDWRKSNTALSDWHAAIEGRPSFAATCLGQ